MNCVSVVIPVYKGAASLGELCARLVQVLEPRTEEFEIILIDDSSPDDSWRVIGEIALHEHRVRGVRLSRNYGQHNALLCGIRLARYDVIVTMDDDLQHPPETVPILLDTLAQGHDVVYGAPTAEQHGFFRNVASQFTKLALQGAMGVKTARSVSAFRAFRTRLRDAFADYRSPHVSIDVLLTWATTNFATVKVAHEARRAGTSSYTVGKLITHAFNMMTGFSTLPLHISSVLGFVFMLFGLAVLAWVVGRYLIGGAVVPGFAFLASIIAIFSGAQLFSLGIVGEYLARMHVRTMERPQYLVREESSEATGGDDARHPSQPGESER